MLRHFRFCGRLSPPVSMTMPAMTLSSRLNSSRLDRQQRGDVMSIKNDTSGTYHHLHHQHRTFASSSSFGEVGDSSRGVAGSSSSSFTPVIMGNTSLGVKKSTESFCRMTDIAQSSSSSFSSGGSSGRVSAGDVLGMMDLCACNVARFHITGKFRFAREGAVVASDTTAPTTAAASDSSSPPANSSTTPFTIKKIIFTKTKKIPISVATVAVDHTPFTGPIMAGDTIVCEGRLIHAGKTSCGVAVEVFRSQFPSKKLTKVCHSFFSLVAIDDKLQKAAVVPALELSTERDILLNQLYQRELKASRLPPQEKLKLFVADAEKARKEEEKGSSGVSSSSAPRASSLLSKSVGFGMIKLPELFDPLHDLECLPNKTKRFKVPIADTRTEANRVFFPQFLNVNKTIFGGELMRWMEAHAAQCGRMFTGNRDVRTIGMYNVAFNDAVHVQDWVTLTAHVVYVHRTTLEVEVEIYVEREAAVVTNKASFVVANFDDAGVPMEIPNGLLLLEESTHQQQLSGNVAKGGGSSSSSSMTSTSTASLVKKSNKWRNRYADARARYELGRLVRAQQAVAFNAERD